MLSPFIGSKAAEMVAKISLSFSSLVLFDSQKSPGERIRHFPEDFFWQKSFRE